MRSVQKVGRLSTVAGVASAGIGDWGWQRGAAAHGIVILGMGACGLTSSHAGATAAGATAAGATAAGATAGADGGGEEDRVAARGQAQLVAAAAVCAEKAGFARAFRFVARNRKGFLILGLGLA